jgi:translation elongation factor EF-Tu-like GTPase
LIVVSFIATKAQLLKRLMSDSAVLNGSQLKASELSEEQYRQLCKQVKQYQIKNGKKKRSKPLLKPIGDINIIDLKVKVQKSPVDWDDIKTGMPFSLDPTGTVLYTKTGKERAICLNTMSPVPVGGASVYRVFL